MARRPKSSSRATRRLSGRGMTKADTDMRNQLSPARAGGVESREESTFRYLPLLLSHEDPEGTRNLFRMIDPKYLAKLQDISIHPTSTTGPGRS